MQQKIKNIVKIVVGVLWGILFLGGVISSIVLLKNYDIEALVALSREFTGENIYTIVILIVLLYVLRNIIFVPASILGTVVAFVFTEYLWLSIVVIGVGEIVSALVAFGIARGLGRKWIATHETRRLQQFDAKVKERGFFTIFVLRLLIFIPFDVVNFGSGFSAITFRDYFWATFFGVWPSVLPLVFLGEAVSDPKNFVFLAAMLIVFFVFIRWVKTHPHFFDLFHPIAYIKKLRQERKKRKLKKVGRRKKRF